MVCLRSLTYGLLAACTVHACNLEARQADESDFLTVGSDGPADAETLGFAVNHLALIVRNLTASIDFYRDALGMRHMFTAQASPAYSVTYMAHAQGGRNGTGFQTGEELLRNKNNAAGLIEFQYFANSKDEDMTASTVRPNTFSHIGLIVPSLEKAQERFDKMGVNITKRIGVSGEDVESVLNAIGVGEVTGINETEKDELRKGQELLGFAQLLVIEDPDGNMIEVQQLVPPPGVA